MAAIKKQHLMQGKDCFSRMNFLYQAAMLYAGKNDTLSAYYGGLCKSIARRATLKFHPNIKRDLCKRCTLALKPGITAELNCTEEAPTNGKRRRRRRNHKSSNERATLQIKCNKCGYERKFAVSDNYSCWLDNPDAVAEILTTPSATTNSA